MPPANEAISKPRLLRTFIFGKDKSKKTWWALKSAEAGFNVILLDVDDGSQIVNQIDAKARDRILIVDLVDTLSRAVGAEFMAMFLRDKNAFTWDEQDKAFTSKFNEAHSSIVVNAAKLDSNTVLILDSWTALKNSTMSRYAIEQNIDLTDARKQEWDGYGFQGRFLNFVLKQLHALPCHVIVVGHQTIYEKRAADGRTIVSSVIQPESSSNPHGATLGKHFNDVLYFQQLSASVYKINAGGDNDRPGGSRLLEPKQYNWDECPPSKLLAQLGPLPVDVAPQTAFTWYAAGEKPELIRPSIGLTKPVLDAKDAQPVSADVTTISGGTTAPVKRGLFSTK